MLLKARIHFFIVIIKLVICGLIDVKADHSVSYFYYNFKKQSLIAPVYWTDVLNKACYASIGEIEDNTHVVADNYGQKAANGAYYPHGNVYILFF